MKSFADWTQEIAESNNVKHQWDASDEGAIQPQWQAPSAPIPVPDFLQPAPPPPPPPPQFGVPDPRTKSNIPSMSGYRGLQFHATGMCDRCSITNRLLYYTVQGPLCCDCIDREWP